MKTLSISLYNRPEYTKILLDHLAECYDINQYLIFIYCEPVNEEVISLAKQFRPNQTIVKINSERFGCNKNIYQCLDAGFNINDFHIHLEDDTIPGKDFLVYCEWCRHYFKHNLDIFSVSGYVNSDIPIAQFIEKNDEYNKVTTRNWFTPWGWATWKDRWLSVKDNLFLHNDPKISWDNILHNILKNKKECFPAVSRIQNIGQENGQWCPGPEWHKKNQYNEYWIETIQKYTTFYVEK